MSSALPLIEEGAYSQVLASPILAVERARQILSED